MQLRDFLKDESGQTTTEYVLILAVGLMIVMQFKKGIGKILGRLLTGLDAKTDVVFEDMSGTP